MDDIKKFVRQCPGCNKDLYHRRKKDRNFCEKNKVICRNCADKIRCQKGNYNPKEEFICFACGAHFMDWRSQLSNPDVPFCSKQCAYNSRTKSLVGQRFGKLIVTERSRAKNTTFYLCLCDCGNNATVSHINLSSGNTKSCGCLIKQVRRGERKPLEDCVHNAILNYYKRNAKIRKYEWLLTNKEFITLISGNCYYCGAGKSNLFRWKYKYEEAIFPFNGIDRIDNTIGYILSNCVSCCKTCNTAKADLSFEEFKEWATRLVSSLNTM